MLEQQKQKIFDDFPTVDCEECECWQLNQCDGISVGSEKPCEAFKATRRLNTPQEIKALEERLERLRKASIIDSISIAALALSHLIW